MDRTLYIDAINDACKYLMKSDHEPGLGEILVQELLDSLHNQNKLSKSEYHTLWATFLPAEESK